MVMPRGHPTPIKWTQKQREIYNLLITQGMTDEEARAAGYGIENILRVKQAVGRGEYPPSYDPSEESLRAPPPSGNGSKPPARTEHKSFAGTATVEHSVVATVKPRDATIYSSMLWQAKQAAIKVFGWPPDMTDSQFLDKWLKKSMEAYGVHIGDFWVEPRVKVAQPSDQEEEENVSTNYA